MVVGGVQTEVEYFEHLKSVTRSSGMQVQVIARGVAPTALVRIAIDKKREDARIASRAGDPRDVFDAVWVVTDVDEFDRDVEAAVALGRAAGVSVAVSNPCFEIWLLWHLRDQTAWIDRRRLQQLVQSLGICDGKAIRHKGLHTNVDDAVARAVASRRSHAAEARACPNDNPSSQMDLLVASVLAS